MELLIEGSAALGIPLSQGQVARFERYLDLLVEWNRKINLTAIDDAEGVQVKHFLDCLAALPLIAEEKGTSVPPAEKARAIDVGTGAGFPGLPLKIAWPSLELTLLDGTGKKVRFLRTLVEALGLDDVTIVQGRAEEVGHDDGYRGRFDLVTARAVARLNTLVEYLLPLCRRGGLVLAYKGPHANEEFIEARKAIETLGGETVRFAPVQIPFLEEERRILLIRKVGSTPRVYPRQQGLPRKSPLV